MSYKPLLPDSGLAVTLVELGLSLLIVEGDLCLNFGQPLLDGLVFVHAGMRNPFLILTDSFLQRTVINISHADADDDQPSVEHDEGEHHGE